MAATRQPQRRIGPKREEGPVTPASYGNTDLDYNEYLKIPELLRLQVSLSRPPQHDELLFITIHQAYELWFKLILHEATAAIRAMEAGEPDQAHHHLVRSNRIMQLLLAQIHLLETMRPIDFLKFRDHLKPASGFQSLQFREIEFLGGLKDAAYLAIFQNQPQVLTALRRRLDGPDLRTAFWKLLAERGFRAKPADVAKELDPDDEARHRLARLILPLYERPAEHRALHALAEALLDFDEALALWREHHWRVVERIIGFKTGTGGSSGVSYLRTTTRKQFFPALWAVRTHLGEGP